ncbi:MAG: FAD:protein FMN transferase, partial [Alphaproteobacteria bacterium]
PLWTLYADHFAAADAPAAGPAPDAVAAAMRRVGWEKMSRGADGICFGVAGMALTLNGIAQGFITDRAYDIMAAAGMRHVLLDIGEWRALGPRPGGGAWRIGVADPLAPWRVLARQGLDDGRAIATSAPAGAPFDAMLRHHHLFDPRTGHSARSWKSVSVVAANAALADALSTALAVAAPERAAGILAKFPDAGALLLDAQGMLIRIGHLD